MSEKRMKGFNWLILGLLAALGQACSPLTNGNNGLSGCAASNQIDTPGDQIGMGEAGVKIPNSSQTINTTSLAQSFVVYSAATITSVSLKLDVVAPTTTTSSTGSVTVGLEQDSISTPGAVPSPTVPNGTPLTSADGTVTATAEIPVSSIEYAVQGSQFYNFSFTGGTTTSSSASPSPSGISLATNTVYWIVAAPSYTPSSTFYVEWRATSEAINYSLAEYLLSTSLWTPIGNNTYFDYQVGC